MAVPHARRAHVVDSRAVVLIVLARPPLHPKSRYRQDDEGRGRIVSCVVVCVVVCVVRELLQRREVPRGLGLEGRVVGHIDTVHPRQRLSGCSGGSRWGRSYAARRERV